MILFFCTSVIMAGVEDFVRAPSAEFVEQCTKEQLLKLAEHYNAYVSDKRLREKCESNCDGKFV